MRFGSAVIGATLVVLVQAPVVAQGNALLIDMRDLTPHELRGEGFVLDAPQRIEIDAAGASENRSRTFTWNDQQSSFWRGNAWILNARTREVVWELRREDTDRARRGVERFEGSLQLPAGEYEVYYASYSALWRTSVGGALSFLTGRSTRESYDDDGLSEGFHLTIRGNGRRLNAADLQRLRDAFRSNAVVTLTSLRRQDAQQKGFQLTRATPVEIYALGEATGRDEVFDGGYIVNADTHERVWSFEYSRSRAAGGAAKNRMLRETVTLPPGRYAAVYAMDDSHDPRDWNAAPPFDPAQWGLTVRVKPEDKPAITTFDYDPTPADQAIVALTRMRDSDLRSSGFALTRPMDVRVYALGEGTNGEMNDYGWIIDAATRRRVWVMDYDRTEHAGGAQKNRVADEVIHLDKGSYLVYFQTDDSHSYRDWNSTAPIGGEDWGISVFPAKGPLDKTALAPFDEHAAEDAAGVHARILNVGDEESRSRSFTLASDADIRIYALGEGSDDEMFDFAWIENLRTGRRVWEMTYGMTTHAGGAKKNRLYDDVVRLPAGEYVLRYRSDGSHSMDSWNADPPVDPARWGVTLFKVNK